jgi:hypothetical protein
MQQSKNRNKVRLGAAAVCLGGMLGATAAFAAPAGSFERLFIRNVEFEDQGSSLSVEGQARNLSRHRGDVRVTLLATAEVDAVCINPGGREVPAQKPDRFEVELEGFERYRARDIDRDGRLEFEVETDAVGSRIPGAPDCPNRNWTERVRQVRFLDARVTVRQENRRVTLLCTFDPATRDGKVRSRNVECSPL